MKCYLHIGTEKTGTTSIQEFLKSNTKALSDIGIYRSGAGRIRGRNDRPLATYFQTALDDFSYQRGITTQRGKANFFEGFLEKFANEIEIASRTHDYFLITSEHFHSRLMDIREIRELHAFLINNFKKIEVICFFRDQFDVAVSLYSTDLWVGGTDDIETFVSNATPKNYYYNYKAICDNWSEVFGRENCNFCLYNKQGLPNYDVRDDFFDVIAGGVDIERFVKETWINEALTLLQARAFRRINAQIPYYRPDDLGINQDNLRAKKNILANESLKAGIITSSESELIRKRFSETNKAFFKKYFFDIDKFPTKV